MNTDYGQCFEAPCGNELEMEVFPFSYICGGTLRFGKFDDETACDRCGAFCGRGVAFHHLKVEPEAGSDTAEKGKPQRYEMLRFLEAPALSGELQALLPFVEREMVKQCGIPREVVEEVVQRDAWLKDAPPAGEVTKGRGVTRRPMLADEVEALRCVGEQVGFSPGTWDKKFARELYARSMDSEQISDKEAAQVWRLFKRYRKQIVHPEKERLLRVAELRAAPEWRKGEG